MHNAQIHINQSYKKALLFTRNVHTMATLRHKSYISMGRNFNNILKYNVLSSNFGGWLPQITKINLKMASKMFE